MRETNSAEGPAAMWRRNRELAGAFGLDSPPARQVREYLRLEKAVLKAPIANTEDALAKLAAVALVFREGARNDGADAAALKQVGDWLKRRTDRLDAAA